MILGAGGAEIAGVVGAAVGERQDVAGMPRRDVDSHRDQDVRSVLAPIAVLAERCELAVLAIGHFPKSATRALLAMGGSVGFSAAARSILVFGIDPRHH